MKARHREVNIFNMSLLDILCGALGAFCFLMLVLFPYWRPGGAQASRGDQQRMADLERRMAELREKMGRMADLPPEARQQFEQMTRQMEEQQRMLRDAQRQNESLRREGQQKDEKIDRLGMREPVAIVMRWSTPLHDVNLYVRFRGALVGGAEIPPVDPTKAQGPGMAGASVADCGSGPCSDVWMFRDIPIGTSFDLYYVFLSARGNPGAAEVTSGSILQEGDLVRLPPARIEREKTAVLVGRLVVDNKRKARFEPAPPFAEAFRQLNPELQNKAGSTR